MTPAFLDRPITFRAGHALLIAAAPLIAAGVFIGVAKADFATVKSGIDDLRKSSATIDRVSNLETVTLSHSVRITELEKAQARAEGAMAERDSAVLQRLDRIERKIDAGR